MIDIRSQKRGLTNIYFIQGVDGGPVKVGKSSNPLMRLRSFQSGSPVELKIVRTIENVPGSVESVIHRCFSELRLHGEWFRPQILENGVVFDVIQKKGGIR